MTYRGVLFDFNGVLLWDADLQKQSWQPMSELLRGYEMTDDELAARMHGRPNADVMSYLAGRIIAGQELRELIELKEGLYRELCLQNPQTFVLSPGAEELLDALAQSAVPRTIATSSETTNLEFFFRHLRLARWFDLAKTVCDDGVRPGKPAPDIYLAAAAAIQLAPPVCVVVEDAISGLASAYAAAAGHIIALGETSSHVTLRACPGVASVIESLEQFPKHLLLPEVRA